MFYADLIEKHLEEAYPILTDGEKTYTYLHLHQGAMTILDYFYRHGAKAGDRVLLLCSNDAETVKAILACLAGGLIFVLIESTDSEEQIAYVKHDCSPALVYEPGKMSKYIYRENRKIKTHNRARVPESAGAYILYTSGSTGIKKGVFARRRQIRFCCSSILSRLKYMKSDKVLCSLPLAFDYGLYQIFLSLLSGAQLFLVNTAVIQMIPKYINRWNITIYPAIPSVVSLLLRMDFLKQDQMPFLRCITFTGEYLPVELVRELYKNLPLVKIVPMYGLTECKRVSIMPEGREDKVLAGSCGLPLDGVNVFLEKENPKDEIGILIVEGPNVMEGYWNCKECGFGINQNTGMRTYRTGDLLEQDDEGFLYFRGRCNGLIKVGGRRISEVELENIIWQVKGVLECAVIGMKSGGFDWCFTERIRVWVYTMDEDIKPRIEETLAQSKINKNFCELLLSSGPLPRSHNGKIDKLKLKKMIYENGKYICGE